MKPFRPRLSRGKDLKMHGSRMRSIERVFHKIRPRCLKYAEVAGYALLPEATCFPHALRRTAQEVLSPHTIQTVTLAAQDGPSMDVFLKRLMRPRAVAAALLEVDKRSGEQHASLPALSPYFYILS